LLLLSTLMFSVPGHETVQQPPIETICNQGFEAQQSEPRKALLLQCAELRKQALEQFLVDKDKTPPCPRDKFSRDNRPFLRLNPKTKTKNVSKETSS